MKVAASIDHAFDRVFLKLARIGRAEDKKFNGTMILITWIMVFLSMAYLFFDQWIYGVHDIYLELWPYRSKNFRSPTSTTFPLASISFVIAFIVAYRTSKRCAHLIRPDENTAKEFLLFFCLFVGAGVGSVVIAKWFEYGLLFVLPAHLLLFYLLSRPGPRAQDEPPKAP